MQTSILSPWLKITIFFLTALDFLQSGLVAFGARAIMAGVQATPEQFSLSAAVYASVAILMIVQHQWLAERFGYRRLIIGSLLIYMLGAVLCLLATAPDFFIVARGIQAVGGAVFFTAGRVQVNRYPLAERRGVLRIFVTGLYSGAAFAPLLAAGLLAHFSWHLLFGAILIPALICLRLVVKTLPHDPAPDHLRSDAHVGGLILLVASSFLTQFILERLPYQDYAGIRHYLLLIAFGLVGIVGFVLHEWRRQRPLIDYRGFVDRHYVVGILLFFFCYVVIASNSYMLPVFLVQGLGLGMGRITGLLIVPMLAGLVVFNIELYITKRYPGPGKFLVMALVALVVYGAGMAMLLGKPEHHGLVLWLLICNGVFAAFGMGAASQKAFVGMDDAVFSHAYQVKNIVREMSVACGISFATMFVHSEHHWGKAVSSAPVAETLQTYYQLLSALAAVMLAVAIISVCRNHFGSRAVK